MLLWVLAVVVLGLMCGSELNVAAVGHPILNQQPLETHVRVRSSFAQRLGRIMPFWMAVSTLLNLLLLFVGLDPAGRRLAAIAFAIQMGAVVFSLVAPVPINNRIAHWTPESLPADWSGDEHRWDRYHWLRTGWLVAAFILLTLSIAV